MRVLILGGTAESRELAARLNDARVPLVSSLAGRVTRPRLPVGPVRVGGFGGVSGLVNYVRKEHITHLVDATHPFAATMTAHAAVAADHAGIPVLRYARPGWSARTDASTWHWVDSLANACERAEHLGRRPFITSGRQTLPAFIHWTDRAVLVRVVEPLTQRVPASWTVIEDRGPFSRAGERHLIEGHGVDVIVTKDSGGYYTSAKLDVAAELSIPVVVLARPATPTGLPVVTSVDDCLDALLG